MTEVVILDPTTRAVTVVGRCDLNLTDDMIREGRVRAVEMPPFRATPCALPLTLQRAASPMLSWEVVEVREALRAPRWAIRWTPGGTHPSRLPGWVEF